MAHSAQINVNGVLTDVTEFDNPAQAIDDAVTVLGAPTTPQAALSALGAGVRPRLGINMDFRFNQKGQPAYTAAGYGLDGWRSVLSGGLTSGSVDFNDPGVTITANGPSTAYLDIYQYFEDDLLGKTVTFSVLYDDGTFLTITGQVPASAPSSGSVTVVSTENTKSGIWIRLNSAGLVYVQIRAKGGYSVSPVSAKPEEGEGQTLAYQDSTGAWHRLPQPEDGDYAGQLEKCQRYLIPIAANSAYGFASGDSIAYLYFPLPTSMRAIPVFQGTAPSNLFPNDGNSVSRITVFGGSAIDNVVTLRVAGSGFTAYRPYMLNVEAGFLSAQL